MHISTTFDIPGYTVVKHCGVARGVIVRTPTISQGFMGAMKSVVGGNIQAYSEMCDQARAHATELMTEDAKRLGANAVVGFRYDASSITGQVNGTEVVAYGTAVVIKEKSA